MMVFDHPLDVQIFDFDALLLIDQLSRFLEMKIAPLSFHFQKCFFANTQTAFFRPLHLLIRRDTRRCAFFKSFSATRNYRGFSIGAASSSERVAKLSIPTSTPTISLGAGATSFFGCSTAKITYQPSASHLIVQVLISPSIGRAR